MRPLPKLISTTVANVEAGTTSQLGTLGKAVNTAGADARKWYRKNRIAEVNLLGMIKNRIRVLHISSSLFLTSLLLLIL